MRRFCHILLCVHNHPTSAMSAVTISTNGLVRSSTSQTGVMTTFAYNRAGRQVRAECAAGVTTFIYDDVYDSAVRRINVSKPGVAFDHDDMVAYGYNSRSELTNAVASVDSDYHDEANAVVDLSFSTCE